MSIAATGTLLPLLPLPLAEVAVVAPVPFPTSTPVSFFRRPRRRRPAASMATIFKAEGANETVAAVKAEAVAVAVVGVAELVAPFPSAASSASLLLVCGNIGGMELSFSVSGRFLWFCSSCKRRRL